jgi:hypothetical protein
VEELKAAVMQPDEVALIWPDNLVPGQLVRMPIPGSNSTEFFMVVGKEFDLSARLSTRYCFIAVPDAESTGTRLGRFRRKALAEHGWI